ncbi:MAG: hypothetical protein A2Y25_10385 [Candidatus Melainabacteria bacterium GWF2_37_15]|nr:MAG: hypothetical protein A2Y25_10385 [Candidatus Melainabacteria bacterium GWF2_37_15]
MLLITDFQEFKTQKISATKKTAINEIDSIQHFQFLPNEKAVYMFDPPLGDKRLYPKSWKGKVESILGQENHGKINSEILFLISFLLNAPDKSYFIGLFPGTFLTTSGRVHYNIRKYLTEKALIGVIKPKSGHVLVIGQKGLDAQAYTEYSAVTIDKELKPEQLELIAKELIKGKDLNFEQISGYDEDFYVRVLDREKECEEHYADIRGYQVFLPSVKHKVIKEPTTPNELIKQIDDKEEYIKTKYSGLKTKLSDLKYEEPKEKAEIVWFLDEEKINEDNKSIVEALNYFYSFEHKDLPIADLDKWQSLILDSRLGLYQIFDYLKLLFNEGRIRFTDNKVEILFAEKVQANEKPDWNIFSDHFQAYNYDENVEKALSYVDDTTKQIYKDFCEYSLLQNRKEPESTLLFSKSIKKKEIILAFSVLKELGLIFQNDVAESEVPDRDVMLYHEYLPYHPLKEGRYY